MAKLENKGAKVNKKNKGKKRKHTPTESDDEEVANKSLIVESTETAEAVAAPTKKAAKRKHEKQKLSKEKRPRTEGAHDVTEAMDSDEDESEELHEPTLEELRESEKPENTNAVVTVRQKKKQKHEARQVEQKDQQANKELQRNEEYLQKWKNARDTWKFEKLRQISIQQNPFDEQKISAELWPIALEYLAGTKGAAREKICKLAEQAIDELDKQCAEQQDAQEQQQIVHSMRYQRARDLLQTFD